MAAKAVYDELALQTESPVDDAMLARIGNRDTIRLLHGVMGMVTEAGEALDALKKHVFYGKPLDLPNLKEECGDTEWYMAIVRDVLGVTQAEIQEANNEKLVKKRYKGGYSHESALNRDLPSERAVFEAGNAGSESAVPGVPQILPSEIAVEDEAESENAEFGRNIAEKSCHEDEGGKNGPKTNSPHRGDPRRRRALPFLAGLTSNDMRLIRSALDAQRKLEVVRRRGGMRRIGVYEYRIESIRVIDGDTIEATVDLGFRVSVREKFRLKGIDAPELPTPEGKRAKEYLEQITQSWKHGVTVVTEKGTEKYGRWLATLYGNVDGVKHDLNRMMVEDGFAKEYVP